MTQKDPTKNWRNVLWREWRYTDDEEYAEQLLEVLTHRLPLKVLSYLLPNKYRRWYFWWQDRPKIPEVENAFHHARKAHPKIGLDWSQSLRRLEYPNEYPASLNEFVADLKSRRWWERFVARHRLFDYGGEAVTPILSLIHEESEFQAEGVHIIQNIAAETTERLITQSSDLVCPNCFTRCHAHKIDLPWQPDITYYGCRACHQSKEFLECPQGIVAMLDANWNESYRLKNGLLWVNWFEQKHRFDFDRIEIIQVTDEDVERFAMQVGNDTDPVRQPRYADMPCLIAPDCQLSENSLRILQNFFGQVERQEVSKFSEALIEKDELTHGENVADEESNAHLLSAD